MLMLNYPLFKTVDQPAIAKKPVNIRPWSPRFSKTGQPKALYKLGFSKRRKYKNQNTRTKRL